MDLMCVYSAGSLCFLLIFRGEACAGMCNQKLSRIPAGSKKASWRGYVESKTKLYTRGKQKSKLARVCVTRNKALYPVKEKNLPGEFN